MAPYSMVPYSPSEPSTITVIVATTGMHTATTKISP
ncbi:hypothetical protein C357_06594 [Citreicella sp. 357]|nr:hypothetical protein C357_06594 [Citreicella sp. 357]